MGLGVPVSCSVGRRVPCSVGTSPAQTLKRETEFVQFRAAREQVQTIAADPSMSVPPAAPALCCWFHRRPGVLLFGKTLRHTHLCTWPDVRLACLIFCSLGVRRCDGLSELAVFRSRHSKTGSSHSANGASVLGRQAGGTPGLRPCHGWGSTRGQSVLLSRFFCLA